jgi:SAM-dependent methyltransferase
MIPSLTVRNRQDLWIGVPRCGGKISGRKGTKLSERSGTLAEGPFSGRHPTSHERLTGLPWDASYHDGPAPWDVGQPQPAIVRLASEGGFAGAVLDAGCGTGENALHVASLGLSVLGVDVAETALAIARAKADDRGIEVEFAAADAFQLERLGRRFATVLDCGLFHTFDGDERPGYVASLTSVTEHDGTLYVLCFSDDGPDTGPHPISQEELRAAFNPSNGWNVAAIEPDRIQTRYHDDGAPAWFATIKRIYCGTDRVVGGNPPARLTAPNGAGPGRGDLGPHPAGCPCQRDPCHPACIQPKPPATIRVVADVLALLEQRGDVAGSPPRSI